jgi:hypothetical protein
MPSFHQTIDKITNSLEEAATGKSLETLVLPATVNDLTSVLKKNGWFFSWKKELKRNPNVYRLIITNQQDLIQGLISYEIMQGYLFMPLVEAAPHNFGAKKQYIGVLPNLVSFVCKKSFDMGFEGVVSFKSKTKLISHYEEKLGAELIGRFGEMAIFSNAAKKLINSYYKNYI